MAGWPSRCEDRSRSLSRDEHMPSVRRLLAFRRSVPRVSSSEEGGMLMRIGMRLGPFGCLQAPGGEAIVGRLPAETAQSSWGWRWRQAKSVRHCDCRRGASAHRHWVCHRSGERYANRQHFTDDHYADTHGFHSWERSGDRREDASSGKEDAASYNAACDAACRVHISGTISGTSIVRASSNNTCGGTPHLQRLQLQQRLVATR
jgi:hypothetical protein